MFSSELACQGGHFLFSLHRSAAGAATAPLVSAASTMGTSIAVAAPIVTIAAAAAARVFRRHPDHWDIGGGEAFGRGGAGGGDEESLMQALIGSAMVLVSGPVCQSLNPAQFIRRVVGRITAVDHDTDGGFRGIGTCQRSFG
uniref:Uncharacterized protein n=1 Tax=Dendrobium officinale TaxID=142615 RepID=A0A1S6YFN7_DENOF|nr:hypothetical protein [Dendrobium officinale]